MLRLYHVTRISTNDTAVSGHVASSVSHDQNVQIDSSTIDGNVEFVHSQYSCILTSQLSTQFLCPTKL